MEETREISALFYLIDDPDDDVFSTVSERIVSFGRHIIPNLENLWENTPDGDVQERIEMRPAGFQIPVSRPGDDVADEGN